MDAKVVRKVKAEIEDLPNHPGRTQTEIARENDLNPNQVSLIKAGRYDHLLGLTRTPPETIPTELASVVSPDVSVHLTATNPHEMAAAQDKLVRWFRLKVASYDGELQELEAAIDEAKRNEWSPKALQAQRLRSLKRRTFYEKCLLAAAAGYCLIPNIPMDVFAIRVKREHPVQSLKCTTSTYTDAADLISDEQPDILPAGEGRYESPTQTVRRWAETEANDKGEPGKVLRKWAEPTGFADLEFPMIAARAEVMYASQKAMGMRIFDQIGVSPEGRKRGDPLIIGQIVDWFDYQVPHKAISFLLAWNVDLRTL